MRILNSYGENIQKGCGRNDSVAGPDVPKVILEKRLQSATNSIEQEKIQQQLNELLNNRKKLIKDVITIINLVTEENEHQTNKILGSTIELTDYDCHEDVVDRDKLTLRYAFAQYGGICIRIDCLRVQCVSLHTGCFKCVGA